MKVAKCPVQRSTIAALAVSVSRHWCYAALAVLLHGSDLAAQRATPPKGGLLGYAEQPGIGSLNPYQSATTTAPTDRALSMIYEPLYRYNFGKNAGWEPVLASGDPLKVQAKAGGKAAYAINLKPHVSWHDGTPFTAEDVIFTYNYIKTSAANRLKREETAALLADVRKGSTPGQVIFEFNRQPVDSREELRDLMIPASRFRHPATFITAKEAAALDPLPTAKSLDRFPMGTGPYQFDRIEYGQPALMAFKGYHDVPANLDRIEGHEYVDQSIMVENFFTSGGPIQMIVEVPPRSLPRIEKTVGVEFDRLAAYNVLAVLFRQKPNSILRDERVRRALTMAVNRDQILETRFGGKGEVVASPIMHESPYWDSRLEKLKYDPDSARKLLRAAGVASNTRLTFIYMNAGIGSDTHIADMVASIKESLEAVGLRIDVQARAFPFYMQSIEQGNFDLALTKWEFNPAYNIRPLFHSDNMKPGGYNTMLFSDKQIDTWLDRYDEADDESLRQDLMYKMQRLLNQKAPALFLLSEDKVYAYQTRYSLPPGTVDPFYFFTYARQWWQSAR